MSNQITYGKRDVDEVEKVGHRDNIVLDQKLTRSVLWKLDTRYA
jgi:hypothetical protein